MNNIVSRGRDPDPKVKFLSIALAVVLFWFCFGRSLFGEPRGFSINVKTLSPMRFSTWLREAKEKADAEVKKKAADEATRKQKEDEEAAKTAETQPVDPTPVPQ